MLVEQLRERIEAYARSVEEEHPLMVRARTGALPPQAIAAYVSNVRYSIRSVYGHLRAARERAAELGLQDVSRWFAHKLDEEYGHDAWAEQDLARLGADFGVRERAPSPSMVELMRYLSAVIQRDPRDYLAYTLFLEYLTVLAGPEFLAVMERHCGIPRSHLSVVARHVELDQHHVREALEEMELLTRGADERSMHDTLERSMDYFARSCHEVARVAA